MYYCKQPIYSILLASKSKLPLHLSIYVLQATKWKLEIGFSMKLHNCKYFLPISLWCCDFSISSSFSRLAICMWSSHLMWLLDSRLLSFCCNLCKLQSWRGAWVWAGCDYYIMHNWIAWYLCFQSFYHTCMLFAHASDCCFWCLLGTL